MIDFKILLQNPELAKSVKLEITGSDLLSLANTLVKATNEQAMINSRKREQYLTIEETCDMVRRDKATLWRWHNKGVLKHNELGLYKASDVEKLLNK